MYTSSSSSPFKNADEMSTLSNSRSSNAAKHIFDHAFFTEDHVLTIEEGVDRLEGLHLFFADEESVGKLVKFNPAVIHAVFTFKLLAHSGFAFWDIDQWENSKCVMKTYLVVAECSRELGSNNISGALSQFASSFGWFKLERLKKLVKANKSAPQYQNIRMSMCPNHKRVEEPSTPAVGEDESIPRLTAGELIDPSPSSVDPQQSSKVFTQEHPGDPSVRVHGYQTVPVRVQSPIGVASAAGTSAPSQYQSRVAKALDTACFGSIDSEQWCSQLRILKCEVRG
ncbi:hypothetical protein M422DRAFT_276199 [Sphaerobolus stellatus SS14]|uniref:Uncharacterized protein n=1 Tax=Sphaerobolus stellatus (strain SS14) TaxID=990650 RepID=A0A0C9UCQ5_SPHS4|nr:hypothetical protein M422DRAFT_276199 [Sphaerobolus stellatus SS14]